MRWLARTSTWRPSASRRWLLALRWPPAAGVMLLVSGATPSDPERFLWLARYTPIILIEISHFLSSILGLVLVLLAFGLRRRLDAAWVAACCCCRWRRCWRCSRASTGRSRPCWWRSASLLLPFRPAFPAPRG